MNHSLSIALSKVEKLASGSIFRRIWNHPINYFKVMWFCKIQYPFTKKGRLVKVPVFYEESLTIQLPAGLDLFITGGKSHASEINLARFLLNTLKPGQHFIDIGAHYGYFSLLAAKLVGKEGKVLAIEPARSTFQLLHVNTVEHTTILALNQAVSNAKELLQFYEFPAQFSEYNTLQPNQYINSAWFASNKPDTYYIATDYLDALLQAHQLLPAIVKIDVEGAEDKVLEGAQELLTHQNFYVAMEFLSAQRGNDPHKKAHQLLCKHQFHSFVITSKGTLEAVFDIEAYLDLHQLDSENIVYKKTEA